MTLRGGYDEVQNWFVAVAPDDIWRLSWGELEEALQSRVIGGSTFIWRDGMEDWLPLKDILKEVELELEELERKAPAGNHGQHWLLGNDLHACSASEFPATAQESETHSLTSLDPENNPAESINREGNTAEKTASEEPGSTGVKRSKPQENPSSVHPSSSEPPRGTLQARERLEAQIPDHPAPLRHFTRLVKPGPGSTVRKRPDKLKVSLQSPTARGSKNEALAFKAEQPSSVPSGPQTLDFPPSLSEAPAGAAEYTNTLLPPPPSLEDTASRAPGAVAVITMPLPAEGLHHAAGKPRAVPEAMLAGPPSAFSPGSGKSLFPHTLSFPAPAVKARGSRNERWLLVIPVVAGLAVAFDVNGTLHRLFRSDPSPATVAADPPKASAKRSRRIGEGQKSLATRPEASALAPSTAATVVPNAAMVQGGYEPRQITPPKVAPASPPTVAKSVAAPGGTAQTSPNKTRRSKAPTPSGDLGLTGEAMDEMSPEEASSDGHSDDVALRDSAAAKGATPSQRAPRPAADQPAPNESEDPQSNESNSGPPATSPIVPNRHGIPSGRQSEEFDPLNPEL